MSPKKKPSSVPRCRDCRRALVWEPPRAWRRNTFPRLRGDRAARRAALARRRHVMRRRLNTIAIRCAWCMGTFCGACAKRHFAPIEKAQRAVDASLARAAIRALDTVLRHHVPELA